MVAEGVEDEASWRLLRDLDCDLVQGYFLARPMSADAMTGWLSEHLAAYATRIRSEDPATPGAGADDAVRATGEAGSAPSPDTRHLRRI